MSNKFCIGDVHGCLYTLEKLLKKLPSDSEIIFTGDLCDKGNFTKEVYELIIDNDYEVIKGNHESLMEKHLIEELEGTARNNWAVSQRYGGENTISSYDNDIETAKKHVEFIKNLKHYKNIDDYFITHGFGLPYFEQRDTCDIQIQRNRVGEPYPDWEDFENYKMINIFGHCDFKEVEVGKNYFGIDTGAVYGNKLTAIEIGTHKIIQQNTIEKDIRK